ncbi:MAG TPA: SMP-30/gluconolactonase/LRE family protein [Cyclobacteriaceae bacterium]|nr:SMP-30/gluconolactonase/LRE family protein [Cyclobacteriaceae bacterium]
MNKKIIVFLVILLGIVGYVVLEILGPAGMFKTILPHFEGTSATLNVEIAGPEDITIDQRSGLAFVSVDDRRANRQSPGSLKGAILIMNLSDSIPKLKNITPLGITDFHPHGISLWREPDGRAFLFVVNHRKNYSEHVIERFEWKNDSLIHIESIQDVDLMTSPNDVTAVGGRSFYVTNDHGYSKPGVGRTLEDYLQRAISYVNYYDGVSFKKVATGIAYANGINQSADHSKIYVASTTGRKVMVYTRDIPSGALSLEEEIKVKTGVDNIELDNQGALWIGCHPQLLKFVAHATDPAKFSPSQVIKITQDKTGYVVEEIFLNDGTTYSGSSVAAIYNNTLLIGSVFEKSIILCTLRK